MLDDFIDDTFADLNKFYPGSKRKRREPISYIKDNIDKTWEDEFFLKNLPNGKTVKMYTLGTLAKAINRSVKTLRYWIDHNQLPASPYRLPDTVGSNGKTYAGRRLYTKAMVDATIDIFAEARLLEVNRIDWITHRDLSDKIAEAWRIIRAEEMQTTTK